MSWLDEIKWDERGLVPVIAQEASTGRVLMLAWMDREALDATLATGLLSQVALDLSQPLCFAGATVELLKSIYR